MKKILYIAHIITNLIFLHKISCAQVDGYHFVESTGNYQHLTSGLVIPLENPISQWDGLPIGFDFKFGGKTYDFFSLSPNGMIRLGNPATTLPWDDFVADFGINNPNAPLIAVMWAWGGAGTVTVDLNGQPGGRVLIIDWYNTTVQVNTTWQASCQLRLYETTNKIEFIYGSVIPTAANFKIPVGLNDKTTFLNILPGNPSAASATDSSNSYPLNALAGKKFTFYPPCAAPANMKIYDITNIGSARVSWDPVFYNVSYRLVVSHTPDMPETNTEIVIDDIVNDTTDLLTMLDAEQTYYVFVKSICGSPFNSGWTVKAVTMPCTANTCFVPEPSPLVVTDVTSWSATVSWISDVTVNGYEIALTNSPTPPVAATYYSSPLVSNITFTNLMASQHYYVFVRSIYTVSHGINPDHPYSTWTMADFTTSAFTARTTVVSTTPEIVMKDGIQKIINDTNEKLAPALLKKQMAANSSLSILKLFPNPAANFINIAFNAVDAGEVNVIVTDIAGKPVLKKLIGVKAGFNTFQAQTAAWEDGVYLVNLVDKNGIAQHSKFIKL